MAKGWSRKKGNKHTQPTTKPTGSGGPLALPHPVPSIGDVLDVLVHTSPKRARPNRSSTQRKAAARSRTPKDSPLPPRAVGPPRQRPFDADDRRNEPPPLSRVSTRAQAAAATQTGSAQANTASDAALESMPTRQNSVVAAAAAFATAKLWGTVGTDPPPNTSPICSLRVYDGYMVAVQLYVLSGSLRSYFV